MKKVLSFFIITLFLSQPSFAFGWNKTNNDELAIKKTLKSQIKYANKADFENFIKTYDAKYVNADGFNLDIYSKLIKDIWDTYKNLKYEIEILDICINQNEATVRLIEKSYANIKMSEAYDGYLKSISNSIYYLEKTGKNWKVITDKVLDEHTTMLYGQAKDLDIKLSAPNEIEANKDYIASLEFTPPDDTIAIASIASDIVEYPQKPTEEVFRALPEDNILERFFTSNTKNSNEYIVASIGLTKTAVCDLNLKLSLVGFGYAIKRVNVIPTSSGENNVKTK